jgi:hypothetical protein
MNRGDLAVFVLCMRGAALGCTWSVHVRQLTSMRCKVDVGFIARDVPCESLGRLRTNHSLPHVG